MPRKIRDAWIHEYQRYTEDTESPSRFHLWVSISVIAATLGRNVYVDVGRNRVYPNMYIILVAGSQACRKSTAIRYGENIIRKLPKPPNIISQKITPEAFIDAICPVVGESGVTSMQSTGYIVASELSVFMTKDSYKNGLMAILVDLYDCRADGQPWEYKTIKHGTKAVYNNCINMLAASSPEYLKISLPIEEIGGGFSARTIFVYQEKPEKRVPIPAFTKEHEIMQNQLVHDLNEISKLKGRFRVDPDAWRWYTEWYMSRDLDNVPEGMEAYVIKESDHIWAIAMILSAAENDRMNISLIHLKAALSILEDNKESMGGAVDALMPTMVGAMANMVYQTIVRMTRENGKATRELCIKRLWRNMDSATFDEGVQTLLSAGLIREGITNTGGVYYVSDVSSRGDKKPRPRTVRGSEDKEEEPQT